MLRHVKMTLEWLPPSVRAELVAVKGGFARVKVYWVSGLDLARDPGANQCAGEVSHGFFHPSDDFHQRHEGGFHQGPSTTRADDHTAGFPICAIFLGDGYLWHKR